jgi:hypothetical protein
MTGSHHQSDEVRDLLSRHQIVFFVGARGTGKTVLANGLEQSFTETGVRTLRLEAGDAVTPADLNDPIASVLGCPADSLAADNLSSDVRLRIIVDACEQLHDRPWLPYIQEQWRALLSDPGVVGRIGILLLGRPLFRGLAVGKGSPLMGIGVMEPARPLDLEDCAEFGIEEKVASAVLRKTGGHPHLTRTLISAIDGRVENLSSEFRPFLDESRRYVMRLIEDHGVAARAVLLDLLETSAGISEAALIAAHFGDSRLLGEECLDDLKASGLAAETDRLYFLKAELVRAMQEIRAFLGVRSFEVPLYPSQEHGDAGKLMFYAENLLRRRVGESLSEIDQAWWPSRIPDSLVAEAELRRRAEIESAAAPTYDAHPIGYLTLGELIDVISSQPNWDQVFRVRFGMTRRAFEDAMSDVTVIRNKAAHNRPVTSADCVTLQVALSRLHLARDEG